MSQLARTGSQFAILGQKQKGFDVSQADAADSLLTSLLFAHRIPLGEDQPHLEILPEVIRNYGLAVQYGHRHIFQSLPRLLTLWFDFGAHIKSIQATQKVRCQNVESTFRLSCHVDFFKGLCHYCCPASLRKQPVSACDAALTVNVCDHAKVNHGQHQFAGAGLVTHKLTGAKP